MRRFFSSSSYLFQLKIAQMVNPTTTEHLRLSTQTPLMATRTRSQRSRTMKTIKIQRNRLIGIPAGALSGREDGAPPLGKIPDGKANNPGAAAIKHSRAHGLGLRTRGRREILRSGKEPRRCFAAESALQSPLSATSSLELRGTKSESTPKQRNQGSRPHVEPATDTHGIWGWSKSCTHDGGLSYVGRRNARGPSDECASIRVNSAQFDLR